jgi:hypothetical protein
MGNQNSEYLKDSWKNFLQEAPDKTKAEDIWNEFNRLLTLLSGTITSLLKIDNTKID